MIKYWWLYVFQANTLNLILILEKLIFLLLLDKDNCMPSHVFLSPFMSCSNFNTTFIQRILVILLLATSYFVVLVNRIFFQKKKINCMWETKRGWYLWTPFMALSLFIFSNSAMKLPIMSTSSDKSISPFLIFNFSSILEPWHRLWLPKQCGSLPS